MWGYNVPDVASWAYLYFCRIPDTILHLLLSSKAHYIDIESNWKQMKNETNENIYLNIVRKYIYQA